MKKEIEIKFTLEQKNRIEFEKWLEDNAEFKGFEHHEDVYLNDPKSSFFFDHEKGFKDAHVTMRLRSKKIGEKRKDLFCTKICYVDEKNRRVFRDEYEIDLNADTARVQLLDCLEQQKISGADVVKHLEEVIPLTKENLTPFFTVLGFTEQFQLTKERSIYCFGELEIVLDRLFGIGSFIEVELKSDEQNVVIGTQQIYDFLKKAGVTQFVQYDRSYLHMKINPEYNFGRAINLQEILPVDKELGDKE